MKEKLIYYLGSELVTNEKTILDLDDADETVRVEILSVVELVRAVRQLVIIHFPACFLLQLQLIWLGDLMLARAPRLEIGPTNRKVLFCSPL